MRDEPRGELARYAFGYSDKRPGRLFWTIHIAMALYVLWALFHAAPADAHCFTRWHYPHPQPGCGAHGNGRLTRWYGSRGPQIARRAHSAAGAQVDAPPMRPPPPAPKGPPAATPAPPAPDTGDPTFIRPIPALPGPTDASLRAEAIERLKADMALKAVAAGFRR